MKFINSTVKEPQSNTINHIIYENLPIVEITDPYTIRVLASILDRILASAENSYIEMEYSELPEYYDVELKFGTTNISVRNGDTTGITECANMLSRVNTYGIFPIFGYYDIHIMDLLNYKDHSNWDFTIDDILFPENMSVYAWCVSGYTYINQINCLRRIAKDKESIGMSLDNRTSIELALLDAQARIKIKYTSEEFSNVHGILLFDRIHNDDMKYIKKFSEKFPNIQCIVCAFEDLNEKLVQ